ncbi:undecaprenyl/decaprenyl-phosphate alpha-N-acetylglucosaminyl 1-phosphate transferase [Ferrovibrio terrae]|uniref:undecaprenyl/decaprenyl-phosphate alpha-N-acetylglucosaminyl 1-phosphate transferase n=1 Tax=Ferrovibrio terrae TaxID=2594003 RepID=UPI003138094D
MPTVAIFLQGLAAFTLAALGVFIGMQIAARTGAMAEVRPDRWHTVGKIPKLAGPGLAAGMFLALPLELWLIAATAGAIGIYDDHRRLSPAAKALLLLLPAVGAMLVTGLWWVGPAIWIAANACNLLDHADGIAAATALAACLFGGHADGAIAAAAIAGFLIFNLTPARSFMGDGGSLMLGTALVLLSMGQGPVVSAAWLALPLADSLLVVISRLRQGQKPWIGGTDHSGHRLLRAGVSPYLLPWLYFGLTAIIATLARML